MGKSIWFASTSPWGLIPSVHVKNQVWLHAPVTLALGGGGRYRWISSAILSDSLVGKKKNSSVRDPAIRWSVAEHRWGEATCPLSR